MPAREQKKALLLSVGYGEGHHAAARAAAGEFSRRGWAVEQVDICRETHPRLFRLTQRFYHFCVRRAPWVWGVTYARADKADWSRAVRRPPLLACCRVLAALLRRCRPDAIVCTYPLFSFMVDLLREEGMELPPCFVVVTDSLVISRPWMTSKATLFCLPDEYSARMVQRRYALPDSRVVVTGFPVRPEFRCGAGRTAPTPANLSIVYGAYASPERVVEDVRGLLALFPRAHITLLAGERAEKLRRCLAEECRCGAAEVLVRCEDMPALFARNHLYIGKAGAATMYEAYSSGIPCIVNYALPGQEQGNLRLLLKDGAGLFVESTEGLLRAVSGLMKDRAAGWLALAGAMQRAARSHGAERLVDTIEQTISHDARRD